MEIVQGKSLQDDATAPKGTAVWPELSAEHPLRKLQASLGPILDDTGHDEIWGVKLSAAADAAQTPFITTLVLQKFLRANANNVEKAAEQLKATLQWRKDFQPLKAVNEGSYDANKFGGLGYVTVVDRNDATGTKDVVTWNIYGAVKDNKKTFGDLDEFIRWRVALMELSIKRLDLAAAKEPIPDHGQGPDPYQMVQVHDYMSVRFLRMDSATKSASQKAISTFQRYYPELLSRKFFVNVPVVMGWLFAAMRLFVAKETSQKLTALTYGEQLVGELGDNVPGTYGGKGKNLGEGGEGAGETVKLVRVEVTADGDDAAADAATTPTKSAVGGAAPRLPEPVPQAKAEANPGDATGAQTQTQTHTQTDEAKIGAGSANDKEGSDPAGAAQPEATIKDAVEHMKANP